MEDLIRRRSIRNMYSCLNAEDRVMVSQVLIDIDAIPAFEPNLILPERVERGEVYDVGETITVMNHEDYVEMLCKAMMWDEYGEKPNIGNWVRRGQGRLYSCSECGNRIYSESDNDRNEFHAYCGRCGAEMGSVLIVTDAGVELIKASKKAGE